jgi:DNA sulfur modification protein DndD
MSTTNFMPYKGQTSIAFPTDTARNVMIVLGDNMRGKTSVLNAVRWAFYGHALDRHLREIPLHALLNSEAASEGEGQIEVHVQFEANGRKYDLRRRATKKPLVARPSRPEDFDVTVGLQRDSVALPGLQIEPEISQIAPEQISRFFLFDGELLQEYESLLIEGSEQGRRIKGAIEQVLGLPALVHGRDEIGTLLKAAQKQQTKDLSHVQGLEAQARQQSQLQDKQQVLDRDLSDLRGRFSETQRQRLTLDDELEAVASVHRAKAEIDVLKGEQERLHKLQEDRRLERQQLLSEIWRDLLDAKISLRRDQLIQKQQRLSAAMSKRSSLEVQINNLRELIARTTCPTCGQRPTEEARGAAGKALGTLESELRNVADTQEALARCFAELEALTRLKPTGAGPKISGIDADVRRTEVELTRNENRIEELTDEIEGFDTADIARKRVLRDQLLREEDRLQNDIKRCLTDIDQVKNDLAMLARTLQGFAAARASKATAVVNLSDSLERVFSESIERLRDNLRTRVAGLATQAFRQMTHQKAYRSLQINDGYGLTIIDDTDQPVSVRSAGAEQIVALSLIDGLNRTGRAAGPIIMDTPFGRLDLKHRANILRYLPTAASQFILLVHDGEFRRETDLAPLAERIGAAYEIREMNHRWSKIERASL